MQSPTQVPPVPSFVFILLSKVARIGALILFGKPAIVVTVFPPLPLFSLRISKRSPLPTCSCSFTFLGLGSETGSGAGDCGRPSGSRDSNGENPKPSLVATSRFPFARFFRLILRKHLSPEYHLLAKPGPFGSFCSLKNALIAGGCHPDFVSRPDRAFGGLPTNLPDLRPLDS